MRTRLTLKQAYLLTALLLIAILFAATTTIQAVNHTPDTENINKNTTVLTEELQSLYYSEDKQACMAEKINTTATETCNVPGDNSS